MHVLCQRVTRHLPCSKAPWQPERVFACSHHTTLISSIHRRLQTEHRFCSRVTYLQSRSNTGATSTPARASQNRRPASSCSLVFVYAATALSTVWAREVFRVQCTEQRQCVAVTLAFECQKICAHCWRRVRACGHTCYSLGHRTKVRSALCYNGRYSLRSAACMTLEKSANGMALRPPATAPAAPLAVSSMMRAATASKSTSAPSGAARIRPR
jgi:hypothetical protein